MLDKGTRWPLSTRASWAYSVGLAASAAARAAELAAAAREREEPDMASEGPVARGVPVIVEAVAAAADVARGGESTTPAAFERLAAPLVLPVTMALPLSLLRPPPPPFWLDDELPILPARNDNDPAQEPPTTRSRAAVCFRVRLVVVKDASYSCSCLLA
jgi:hypothetical protein